MSNALPLSLKQACDVWGLVIGCGCNHSHAHSPSPISGRRRQGHTRTTQAAVSAVQAAAMWTQLSLWLDPSRSLHEAARAAGRCAARWWGGQIRCGDRPASVWQPHRKRCWSTANCEQGLQMLLLTLLPEQHISTKSKNQPEKSYLKASEESCGWEAVTPARLHVSYVHQNRAADGTDPTMADGKPTADRDACGRQRGLAPMAWGEGGDCLRRPARCRGIRICVYLLFPKMLC